MAKHERNGERKSREQITGHRVPRLGYYLIVTDTKETEQNYVLGLRDSIPKEMQDKLVVKVQKTKTKTLIEEAMEFISLHPQYGEPWIVFDRDQIQNFDEIIEEAERKGISVGWTNPCIEEWFSAYFGTMPAYSDSVSCCSGFGDTYKKVTGQKYEKNDKAIYGKLNRFGNQERAIKIAADKYKERKANCNGKPSEMCPCTTVHVLVNEIVTKIQRKE